MNMENSIRKIVYSFNKIIESYHDLKDSIKESSQIVRQGAIGKYGWTEKNNSELSSGGEITKELADIVNKLAEEFSKVSPNCKPRITAGNDQYHQDNKKKDPNYTTLHVSGQAMDVALDDKSCHPKFIELLNKFKQEYNGFSYLNEYERSTKYKTAPHFHLSYRAGKPEGSGKGSSTTQPTQPTPDDASTSPTSPSTTTDSSFQPSSNVEVDTGLAQVARGFGSILGMKESLSENIVFGTNTIFDGTRTIIPHTLNKYIYSSIDGTVKRFPFSQKCTDSVYIESWDGNYGIQYCGVNDVKKSIGDDVLFNDIIGKTSQDIYAVVYNRRGKIMDPRIVVLSKKPLLGGTGSNNNGDDDDDDKYKKPYVEPEYPDAALAALFRLPFLPFTDSKDKKTGEIKKNWASPTSKNQPKKSSWFKSPTSKNESKLNEEILKIKKLLK